MGWFGDLSETREKNRIILDSLKSNYDDTEVTFSKKYSKQGIYGNLWNTNSISIINANEKILDNEVIEKIVLGMMGLPWTMAIFFTNRRVISALGVSNLPFVATWEDLRAFEKVNFWGECRISTRNNENALKIPRGIINPDWYPMIESYFNNKVISLADSQNPLNPNQGISSADELEKFAKLKDQGIITEEEFNTKKRQILNL